MPDAGDTAAARTATTLDAARAAASAGWRRPSRHELANPLGAIAAFADDARQRTRGCRRSWRDSARLLDADDAAVPRASDRRCSSSPVAAAARARPRRDRASSWTRCSTCSRGSGSTSPSSADLPTDLPPVDADPSRLRQLLVVLLVDALRGLGERPRGGRGADRRAADDGPGRRGAGGRHAARTARRRPARPGCCRARDRRWTRVGGTLRGGAARRRGPASLALPMRRDGRRPTLAPGRVDRRPRRRAAAATVLVCDDERLDPRAPRPDPRARRGARHRRGRRAEALALIERDAVDVVLTDQRMRGMSGIELLRGGVARAAGARPPVRR